MTDTDAQRYAVLAEVEENTGEWTLLGWVWDGEPDSHTPSERVVTEYDGQDEFYEIAAQRVFTYSYTGYERDDVLDDTVRIFPVKPGVEYVDVSEE